MIKKVKGSFMQAIDFRSDTVTRPTQKMRQVMANAVVGDDVYGDDPTVNELQVIAAEKLGYEDAIFAASGTQTNLIALMAHCDRGDEYLVGQQAHTYKFEGGGAAVLGSIQPQPILEGENGCLPLDDIKAAIKPIDPHFARTRLLCLENTHSGRVQSLDYIEEATSYAKSVGLACHLDGARLFNAVVKQNIDVKQITQHFDSVSICLSKGLAAPVGSLLCGTHELINKARRWKKVLGGGMRQAGILAAAGIVALNEQVERLAEDHENALILAHKLANIEELTVDMAKVQTNMVFAELKSSTPAELASHLESNGILISPSNTIRFVTHKDVNQNDIETAIGLIKGFFYNKK